MLLAILLSISLTVLFFGIVNLLATGWYHGQQLRFRAGVATEFEAKPWYVRMADRWL